MECMNEVERDLVFCIVFNFKQTFITVLASFRIIRFKLCQFVLVGSSAAGCCCWFTKVAWFLLIMFLAALVKYSLRLPYLWISWWELSTIELNIKIS